MITFIKGVIMKFFILLLICFSFELFATQTVAKITHGKYEKIDKKFLLTLEKAEDTTRIIFMMTSPVRSPEWTKLLNKRIVKESNQTPVLKPYYYTHLIGKVDDKLVYDLYPSEFFSENPAYSFTYKFNQIPKKIEFIVTDNEGEKFSFTKSLISQKDINKIPMNHTATYKKPNKENFVDFRNRHEVWDATTPEEAIKVLFGSNPLIHTIKGDTSSKMLRVQLPEIVQDMAVVPINVTVSSDIEYVLVLSNGTPRSTVAAMNIPRDKGMNFYLRLKLMRLDGFNKDTDIYKKTLKKGRVVVIAKARDGQLYKVEKNIQHFTCIRVQE